MDVFPKFIIEGDNLVIGKSTYHKQMSSVIEDVKGGGFWKWDKEKKEFTLYGESHDFGAVTADELQACIDAGNVFFSYIGGRVIEDHTFYLNTGYETIKIQKK